MIRTLHIDTGREMRGGQWQCLSLVEHLENAVLLARAGAPLFEEAQKRGIDVRPLSITAVLTNVRKVDLVHAHDARAHTLAALASGPPLVVSRRVAFPVKTSLASRWKYDRPALYLAVSNFVADRLRDADIEDARIRIVYDGVEVPKEPGNPEPGRIVALAGKPVTVPGFEIHLTRNLIDDLSTAAVFLYKSDLEGLGSAALVALAAGVPVIASRVGGLPEVVEHEATGLLVDGDDFATPLHKLLNHPEAARAMGLKGRERVQQRFTMERMVEATKQAYSEAVECS